jgi:hypothetical protein
MSLTVSGVVFIVSDVLENSGKQDTTYFNFTAVSKDPYKEGRKFYKLGISVPKDKVESARKVLQKGKGLQIRLGELDGKMVDQEKNLVAMNVISRWQWIEPLSMTPNKERQT